MWIRWSAFAWRVYYMLVAVSWFLINADLLVEWYFLLEAVLYYGFWFAAVDAFRFSSLSVFQCAYKEIHRLCSKLMWKKPAAMQ